MKYLFLLIRFPFTAAFLSFGLVSCETNSFENRLEYRSWIFSEESGYLKTSISEDLIFQLVYLPNNLEQANPDDEVWKFQLYIKPKELSKELLQLGVGSKEVLEKRVQLLEFKTQTLFSTNQKDGSAIFSHYENYRGLKNEILIHAHFAKENHAHEAFTVTFRDDIFQTGEHHFTYNIDQLNHPPILKQNK